mmetsp:Transcript_33674/g.41522  ORF Transcript_33674/g.41522 Transcript_33674/m.41522 type:complete len:143 (+) Transcript_33674:1056-1484(+)|eukprot:CAMPEP_0170462146 /NCGR_PEP_ID=MMETSP0123-20130129/7763_1 /TAXON_ID=182087 /ORGANISM="Favella ehrenbergii, Strain Fehren 1" /LENGTH=142 /DNA_ID=CAMNT_0010727297 /DNA_START=1035 /DNA_END=1463 /DNA_ORIENTATION=-
MRMLQNICLLPNLHLLIEGGLLDQTVEVYELSKEAGSLSEPIHVIQTEARGLSAIDHTADKIYMGFQGAMNDVRGMIHVYDKEYQFLSKIYVAEESCSFSDLTLVRENNFLVTNHMTNDGLNLISTIDLEGETVESIEPPFG